VVVVTNSEIADIFREVADILEIQGANPFRVRAYRTAARTVSALGRNVADMINAGEDLTELQGIGEDLAGKIEEIVETGSLEQLEHLKNETSPELAKLLEIEELGPKRVRQLHEALGVNTLKELEEAAEADKIERLEGFGSVLQEKILASVKGKQGQEERIQLRTAEDLAMPLVAYLRSLEAVQRIEVAGSYRRRQETVGDLDILTISDDWEEVSHQFINYDAVVDIVSQGKTRSTVILRTGLQVDLRVVSPESHGAALFYFTGSKAHNIAIRNLAIDRGMKVNEYGVFEDDRRIAGETEEEIYGLFDLPFIPPELREDRGEIEAARKGELPDLVTVEDIRGDLQMHTDASDGRATLEEMVRAAQKRGYEYIAITDHSPHVVVTQGLDADALAKQIDEIDAMNDQLDDIRILKSIEVDILADGSLDLPNSILSRLDLTLCSIHSSFGLSREKQTERIIRAMDNPNFNILAHPTGRRIGDRAPIDVDLERVMEAALERNCFLEVNAQPDRLDLNDIYSKMAKEMGLKLSISTDAHSPDELAFMAYGVYQARRGWLEADDILNTQGWKELQTLLARD
jgi:DNA polymerase (family 10)